MSAGAHVDDSWWAGLVASLLNPVQIEIIEALRCIDEPLSTVDLLRVLEDRPLGRRVEHHLRRLRKLDAIAFKDETVARPAAQRAYVLRERRPL